MKKQFSITIEGKKEFERELKDLISQRGDIAERIKLAREFGDLTENAEYASAREVQEQVEGRILELENILQNCEVIKKPTAPSEVKLGSSVKLKSNKGLVKEFQVVGTVQADPMNGKISDESPIGQQLLGKKLDETVEIKTPASSITYKITFIG